jgi:phage repressor protein C with HTH and peptisase S24 domain
LELFSGIGKRIAFHASSGTLVAPFPKQTYFAIVDSDSRNCKYFPKPDTVSAEISLIGVRIKQLIADTKLSVSAFAKSANVNYSTLHTVVGTRKSKPSTELLSAILAAYPNVRPDWLLHGIKPMYSDEADYWPSVKKTRVKRIGESLSVDETPGPYDQPDRDQDDAIPFVPITAEGSYLSGFADEEYIEHLPKFYLPFLGLGAGVYAFQVRGDSMSDRFNNGDVVFGQKVNELDALRWGEVYVLLCNDGLVVKELRRGPDDKHFTLRSYNEHFDPYEVLKTEVRAMYRYQASISFNSSNPNRGGVINFLQLLSQQMSDINNSLSSLPQVK